MDGALNQGGAVDRRRTVRRKRTELAWFRGLRLRPGLDAALVDLSAGGALVETPSRLRPGGRAALRLTGVTGSWSVSGQVLRSWVAALEPERGVVYRGALVFDEALEFPGSERDRRAVRRATPTTGQQLPATRAGRPGMGGQGLDRPGFQGERRDGIPFDT